MKKEKFLFGLLVLFLGFTQISCSTSLHQTQVRYMPVIFDSLQYQRDFTIDRNLTVTTTIEKNSRGVPRGRYMRNYKQGIYNGILVPKAIDKDGLLVDLQPQQTLGTRIVRGFWRWLTWPFRIFQRKEVEADTDPALDFALFELFEKHPEYDYFTNLRIERQTTESGNIVETITLKAHGVKILSDQERPQQQSASQKAQAVDEEHSEAIESLRNELKQAIEEVQKAQQKLREEWEKLQNQPQIEEKPAEENLTPPAEEETGETLEGDD